MITIALKAARYLLPGLLAAGLLVVAAKHFYQQGYQARDLKAQLEYAEQMARAQAYQERLRESLHRTMEQMADIQADAEARIRLAEAERVVTVETVERIIRENPDFGDIERPADLQRMRDQQLRAIAAAARASAAAELPRASVPRVPSPSRTD